VSILAIDPGYGRVGVALMEKADGADRVLYSGCIETSSKDELPERLLKITSGVEELIKRWQPETLAIEKLFFNTNQKTAMAVSEARGAIINTAKQAGLSIAEYTPLQIKIAVTGYGKADKRQVTEMVTKLVKLDVRTRLDDEYDAIATGLTHLATVQI